MKRSVITGTAVLVTAFAAVVLFPGAAHGIAAALVVVANTAANPVPIQDIDAGARAPFQISQNFGIGSEATACTAITVYSVPAAPPRRLVIETISFQANSSDSNHGATLSVATVAGGNEALHTFGTTPTPFRAAIFPAVYSVHWFISNPSVRLYADPGTSIRATECVPPTPDNIPSISLSGYFVNLP